METWSFLQIFGNTKSCKIQASVYLQGLKEPEIGPQALKIQWSSHQILPQDQIDTTNWRICDLFLWRKPPKFAWGPSNSHGEGLGPSTKKCHLRVLTCISRLTWAQTVSVGGEKTHRFSYTFHKLWPYSLCIIDGKQIYGILYYGRFLSWPNWLIYEIKEDLRPDKMYWSLSSRPSETYTCQKT